MVANWKRISDINKLHIDYHVHIYAMHGQDRPENEILDDFKTFSSKIILCTVFIVPFY